MDLLLVNKAQNIGFFLHISVSHHSQRKVDVKVEGYLIIKDLGQSYEGLPIKMTRKKFQRK